MKIWDKWMTLQKATVLPKVMTLNLNVEATVALHLPSHGERMADTHWLNLNLVNVKWS